MKKTSLMVMAAAVFAAAVGLSAQAAPFADRWVNMRNDLMTNRKLVQFEEVAKQAAAAGFNGILFDGGIGGEGVDYHRWTGKRLRRLRKAKSVCRDLGLEIIPMIWSVGRAHAIVDADPTLAEAIPVKGLPYVCTGGEAVYDETDGKLTDIFGGKVVLDATGKRKMEKVVPTKPFRRYLLRFKGSTEGFPAKSAQGACVRRSLLFYIYGQGKERGRIGTFLGAKKNDKSFPGVVEFVSRDNESVKITANLYDRADRGRAEIENLELAAVGLRRPVIRSGAPFVVRDAATGAVYRPGRDYGVPKSDASPFTADDRDVAIVIPSGSAIKKGTRLIVDAYEAARISARQVSACMSNPALYSYFEKSIAELDKLFDHPQKWFLSMDEIRAGGTCGLCEKSGMDGAHRLAHCLARQRDIIRKIRPDAIIYAWSDMYDPFVNAKPKARKSNYALNKGGYGFDSMLAPKDIVSVVWGGEDTAEKSLRYFEGEGVPTLYAGFYDVSDPQHFRVKGFGPLIGRIPHCRGSVYTSWSRKYDLVKEYGETLKAAADRE